MAVAVLALGGLFVSLYLWLHAIGLIGSLRCGEGGGCEVVQASRYAWFLGQPVALYGVAGYLTILAVALVGLQPGLAAHRGPRVALAALAGVGFAFTLYLKYVEFFVIGAVCWWCVVSAVLITVIFGLALAGVRRRQPA